MRSSENRSFAVSMAVSIAVLLVVASGCTMCPDPFDYSGPVPNGTAPQNDFRARSNGIIAIGATPRPWPTVVQAAPSPPQPEVPASAPVADDQPVIADVDADTTDTDTDTDTDVLRLSAEVAAEAGATTTANTDAAESDSELTEVAAPLSEAAPNPAPDADVDADANDETRAAVDTVPPAGDRRTLPSAAGATARPAAEMIAPAGAVPRETPGWRPRR
ncbi:MAG: hypothetical protein ACK6CT_01330 [Planctomycetia bacterium]|jgi:hypothetical protein